MTSYLITGVSRGIGFEFLRQLSSDAANTVIGIVRNKDATEKKIVAELGRKKNVHIFQADLTDYAAIKGSHSNFPATVDGVTKITGGKLDIIIANAGFMSPESAWGSVGELGEQPERFEEDLLYAFKANVIGTIHLFNLFMPLILKGKTKKVLAISTGLAADDWTTKYDMYWNAPYVISKAGLNTAVAKFSAQYRKEGVLFLAVCPGAVDTGYFNNLTEEQMKKGGEMFETFRKFAPDFAGPVKPEAAVKDVLSVLDKADVTTPGMPGAFLSHLGNKQWL